MALITSDVVVRNAPPMTVVGADWFLNFPIDSALKWASLVWIAVQAGFFLYDKYRKHVNGS